MRRKLQTSIEVISCLLFMKKGEKIMNAITGRKNNLYERLKFDINDAVEMKFIVSFLMESGIKLIADDLEAAILNGAKLKIITGTYLNITEPSCIYYLKDRLGDKVDIRFFNIPQLSFHPKTYIINKKSESVLYIGSSNMSRSALIEGVEWNYRLDKKLSPEDFQGFEDEFDYIYENQSDEVTDEKLRQYASIWVKPRIIKQIEETQKIEVPKKIEPFGHQIEALYELKKAREEGIDKGMVVAATGTGKTYLSAFDSLNFEKVLFIAHRKEILEQAYDSFNNVRPNSDMSFFMGDKKDTKGDVIFASVQTLGKDEYLCEEYFSEDYFDYIIVDEFHHAAAATYTRIINYFKPKFLLGLTATPYRMDNKDIFEICNDNIIYEINLKDAINRDILVPFKYYGVYDDTNYDEIEYKNGKYNIEQLEKLLSTEKRADLILSNYLKFAGKRTIGFCTSIVHTEYMAEYFSQNGIKSVAVHSSNSSSKYFMDRDEAIEKLERGEIQVIFAVDIFNEGVDIPSLDTVLFLRPTESYVVFLQQLGRGLRKFEDKDYLVVIDFIGNYKKAHYIPKLLAGENPLYIKETSPKYMCNIDLPEDRTTNFDLKLMDLFEEMRKRDPLKKRMREEYFRLKESLERRPDRVDIYQGIDIPMREYLKKGYLRFLYEIDELNEIEKKWIDTVGEEFLIEIEKTAMSKSYKIPVLLSFIKGDKMVTEVSIEEVGKSFMDYYSNDKVHSKDFRDKKHKDWKQWSLERYTKEAVQNPIKFLSRSKFFAHDEINNTFSITDELSPFIDENFIKHYLDILKYREIQYFARRFKEEEK